MPGQDCDFIPKPPPHNAVSTLARTSNLQGILYRFTQLQRCGEDHPTYPFLYLQFPNLTEDLKGNASQAVSAHRVEHILTSRKLAIPRLAEGLETFSTPGRFHRRHVSRACESCRQRKTKCTGDKSGCRNCREAGIICCYTDGKREKSKRCVFI